MWNPPGPGIEPLSPALAGGLSTTLLPGKSWEHLYVNCLNSPVVGLGFEPWSVWLSLCAMVSYLYKFISFDYKIHHIREKVGQSGRCAMDLQFLYWVPRIIILNNPFPSPTSPRPSLILIPVCGHKNPVGQMLLGQWRLRKLTSVPCGKN